MKMIVVIGVEGIQNIIFKCVLMFTSRKNLVLKNSKQEALDWLIGQQKKRYFFLRILRKNGIKKYKCFIWLLILY
jgi:hypothetical protein